MERVNDESTVKFLATGHESLRARASLIEVIPGSLKWSRGKNVRWLQHMSRPAIESTSGSLTFVRNPRHGTLRRGARAPATFAR